MSFGEENDRRVEKREVGSFVGESRDEGEDLRGGRQIGGLEMKGRRRGGKKGRRDEVS